MEYNKAEEECLVRPFSNPTCDVRDRRGQNELLLSDVLILMLFEIWWD